MENIAFVASELLSWSSPGSTTPVGPSSSFSSCTPTATPTATTTDNSNLETVMQEIKKQRTALEDAKAKLQTEREMFEDEKMRMTQLLNTTSSTDNAIVRLDVGGKIFECKRSTLCHVPGTLLSAMFSGRWEDKLLKNNESNAVFLDYNPYCFGVILNFLRAKQLETPDCPVHAPKVREEERENFRVLAHYLGLDVLFDADEDEMNLDEKETNNKRIRAQTHKWQYENGYQWLDFAREASAEAEDMFDKYLQQKITGTCVLQSGFWRYLVDYVRMKQINVDHADHKMRNIRRVPLSDDLQQQQQQQQQHFVAYMPPIHVGAQFHGIADSDDDVDDEGTGVTSDDSDREDDGEGDGEDRGDINAAAAANTDDAPQQ